MDILQTSYQTINALFTFLSQLQNTFVWATSADYKKPLFFGDGFENIWGFSKEKALKTNEFAKIMKKSLYCDDLAIVNKAIKNFGKKYDHCTTLDYRILRPGNKLRYIKGISYTACDNRGEAIGIVGVDEIVSAEQWFQTRDSRVQNRPLINELSKIFKDELKLILPKSKDSVEPLPLLSVNADNLSQTNLKNIGNNENPKLRHSELDCARYLLMGKPMREIAEELLISPRTVETHIENIKNKLGCNKKSEVISKLLKRINPFLFFEEKNYE